MKIVNRLSMFFGEIKGLANSSLGTIRRDGLAEYLRILRHQSFAKRLSYLWASLTGDSVEREILGSKMRLDTSKGYYCGVQRTLFIFGWYEPQCTKVTMEELEKGMTVVDIGANAGYYALLEARIVGDTGKVYAIEPAPGNIEALKKNVSMNSLSNVEIYPLAVGNKNGKGKLHLSISPNLHNMLGVIDKSGPRSSYQDVIEVETVTLDEFLEGKNPPDFIRMDVEGFEYFIIEGMQKTLNQNRNIKLYIEMHPSDMKQAGLKIETMLGKLFDAGLKPKYLVKRTEQYPWQNPNSDSINIDSFRFEGSLEDLVRNIDNADGLFMEKVVS